MAARKRDTRLVAVVCGATRGAGRGAARALGEAGAVVYCTGRSTRQRPSAYHRPETIDETAELVTAAGGTGIPVPVDHSDEAQVRSLFDRVATEHSRLDAVVDSVAGEDPIYGGWTPLWSTDVSRATAALTQGLATRIMNARYAGTLLRKRKRGLIVQVTGADFPFYGGNLVHDIVMLGHKGLAFHIAEELRRSGVASVAITPGFLRSESMLERFGVTEATWRDGGKKDKHFLHSESPLLIGRAIVALATDPGVMRWSGHLTSSWEVAAEYGLTDSDGSNPDWGENWTREVMKEMPQIREGTIRQAEWLERVARRLRGYLGEQDASPVI
jgi:NAD(P)-dependent dehydrogenase (short-subunit alcohol dehydrogenase family)